MFQILFKDKHIDYLGNLLSEVGVIHHPHFIGEKHGGKVINILHRLNTENPLGKSSKPATVKSTFHTSLYCLLRSKISFS